MKPAPDLRLGDWREVLRDVERVDSIIADPPYGTRTHEGQRSSTDLDRPVIAYASIDAEQIADLAAFTVRSRAQWVVIFSDHNSQRAWSCSLESVGLYVFAPVAWVKPNTPRFQGDGPACSTEWITVARPRAKVRAPGSRPGHYIVSRGEPYVIGSKSLDGMRALVRDYSRPGDLICDPYAGGGTTLLAATLEGRRSVGAELDPKTHALASARLRGVGPESDVQPNLFATLRNS